MLTTTSARADIKETTHPDALVSSSPAMSPSAEKIPTKSGPATHINNRTMSSVAPELFRLSLAME